MKRGYWLLIGLAVGIGLGLFIGWGLLPGSPELTSPGAMRADYQDEYIRLVAVSYQVEKDLDRAHERLAALNAAAPTACLVEMTERWIADQRDPVLVAPLARLAHDLGVETASMLPYLEPETP